MNSHYTVSDLGTLGGDESVPVAINDQGQVVGNADTDVTGYDTRTVRHAYLWDRGRMKDLGAFHATGLNNHGQVIGVRYIRQRLEDSYAVIYRDHKVKRLLPKSVGTSSATGINDLSQIVGTIVKWSFSAKPHTVHRRAFLWHEDRYQSLDMPADHEPWDNFKINNKGRIVGTIQSTDRSPSRMRTSLWADGKVTLLGTPPGLDRSRATDINNRGEVISQAIYDQIDEMLRITEMGSHIPEDDQQPVFFQQPFLWRDGHITELGALRDDPRQNKNGIARAMNDRGQIVGTTGCDWLTEFGKVLHAFLYENGEMLDLNSLILSDSGWTLTDAVSINNYGQIVGLGRHDGRQRSFLLTPVHTTNG